MSDTFDGINSSMSTLHCVSSAQTRSVSPENPTGEPGRGGMAEPQQWSQHLGKGWKCRPYMTVKAGESEVMADIQGPGAVQQIWMTIQGPWRMMILRIYYDDCEYPAVECPLADFFASPHGDHKRFAQVSSLAVCVNPGAAMNCFWTMPFRKRFCMTIENVGVEDRVVFYQVNFVQAEVSDNSAYLHAQFRRVNPLPKGEVHTILNGVRGVGHYVGTVIGWGTNTNGWWGEGEVKFFLDDDDEYPTICGTGTEDYFLGAWNFENQKEHRYQEYSTPYAGMPHVWCPDGLYESQQRFAMYRWHITDPIRFRKSIRVTIQALGWDPLGHYRMLSEDIASTAFWYQESPTEKFPPLPDREGLSLV